MGAVDSSQPRLMTRNYMLAFTGNFLMFFSFYLLLPILPIYLAEQFAANKTMIGVILSAYTITALCVRPFAGFMVDYYQRKSLLLITYALFVLFFAGYIVAGTLVLFALVRSFHGFAFGLVTTSQSTVAIDVMHPERRNEGIGYFGLSSNIAVASSPMFSMYLFEGWHNYDLIFILAFSIGILGLCCLSFLKLKHRERVMNQPVSLDRFVLKNAFPGFFVLLMMSFGYGLISTYVAVYAKQELGIASGTGLFFFFLALGMILSRLVTPRWLRKGELVKIITAGNLILIAALVLFVLGKSELLFYLSAPFIGMAYGFICPAYQTIFVNLARNDQRGTASSTYFTSFDMGVGLGVMLGGKIADSFSYSAAFSFALLLVIGAGLLFRFYAANHYHRNKLKTQ